jgi:hypothetical protein
MREQQLGLALKADGLKRVADNSYQWLDEMRRWLTSLHYATGNPVTSEDARSHAISIGWHPHHRNAYGALFRAGWKPVGWVKCKHAAGHARMIRQWVRT